MVLTLPCVRALPALQRGNKWAIYSILLTAALQAFLTYTPGKGDLSQQGAAAGLGLQGSTARCMCNCAAQAGTWEADCAANPQPELHAEVPACTFVSCLLAIADAGA